MIYSIFPDEIAEEDGGLLARVGQITYFIQTSQIDVDTLTRVSGDLPNKDLQIYTIIEPKETQIDFIGFSSLERKTLYQGLKNVVGIGTRSALTILETGEVIDILRAVSGEDKEFLSGVPGVGDKRLDAIFDELEKRYKTAMPKPVGIPVSVWVETRTALIQDGYSLGEAEKIIRDALHSNENENIDSEELHKLVRKS